MKKTTLIAKRATLSYRPSIVVYISLFLFVAFLIFEVSLLFTINNSLKEIGFIITIAIGTILEIVLTIFFARCIIRIKFNNSLTKNAITYDNNIFTICTPYETIKINKSQITRIIYGMKNFCNYGTLFICYLDKQEMLITLKNIVDPKLVQNKIEDIIGLNLIDEE